MKAETLRRAWEKARLKINNADHQAEEWLAEREKRRRQEAAFFRGIVRRLGSQRKAAEFLGVSHQTVGRTLDPEGHAKARKDDTQRRAAKRGPSSQKLGPPTEPPSNVIPFQQADIPAGATSLRDLFDPNENYWSHKRVHDVVLALNRCSAAEAAFFYTKGVVTLSHHFKGRMLGNGKETTEGNAKEFAACDD